jgi:hypothetical protein
LRFPQRKYDDLFPFSAENTDGTTQENNAIAEKGNAIATEKTPVLSPTRLQAAVAGCGGRKTGLRRAVEEASI